MPDPDRNTPQPTLSQADLQQARLANAGNREIGAAGPRPGTEPLRRAYLDLLKLVLCDLVGARTQSVIRSGDGRATNQPVFARELLAEELPLRTIGADWPLSGLTMVGLTRLDDLQSCVERIVGDGVEGDLIEAGAWRGGASILMRAALDTLGGVDRAVWVADSFQGLPPPSETFPEDRDLDLSWLDYLAVSREEVRRNFAGFGLCKGVRFLEGFFEDTLPGLTGERWSLVRLDGDTYEATWIGLESLYPRLSDGGYVVIDDYQLISECRRAVDDYRAEAGIHEPLEMIDDQAIRWRRKSAPAKTPRRGRPATDAGAQSRSVERPERTRIPSERELQLRRERDQLRAELLGTRSQSGVAKRLSRLLPAREEKP
jgi:O-methyltransferase